MRRSVCSGVSSLASGSIRGAVDSATEWMHPTANNARTTAIVAVLKSIADPRNQPSSLVARRRGGPTCDYPDRLRNHIVPDERTVESGGILAVRVSFVSPRLR